jgi:hypothetical protein
MATSLSIEDVREQLGQDEPQDAEQEIGLRIWEQLSDTWQAEEAFLRQLARIAGLEEGWQEHDLSALLLSLHSGDYVQVRRAGKEREVRRNPTRPRFFSFTERAENDTAALVVFQREQTERAEAAERERREELEAPQRQAESEELAEAIDRHPTVVQLRETVADLESELRLVRAKLTLQELGGTTEDK